MYMPIKDNENIDNLLHRYVVANNNYVSFFRHLINFEVKLLY